MCGKHKYVKAQGRLAYHDCKLRLAYHDCKNLAHTSKTHQVKRTQMVATAIFTIRVFALFIATF